MALGGSFVSISGSDFSFIGNPASFAAQKGSLDITANAWAYVQPTMANLGTLTRLGTGSAALQGMASLMTSDNGMGGGAYAGIGYAGMGFGLGLFAISDDFAAGSTIPGAVLQSDTEVDAVFGLGLPIKLFGDTLSIGGDFRPYYRVRANDAFATVVTELLSSAGGGFSQALLDSVNLNAGFGLSMDLGASLQMGSFDLGIAVRNLSPSFPLWTGSYQYFLNYIENAGSLPVTSNGSDQATFLPDLSVGLSWKPRLLPGIFEPSLYLEAQDPVRVVENWQGSASALQLIHAGAEIKLFSFLSLRGGINQGWLSAGAGIKFLYLDLDAAVFTQELGALPGDDPRSGLTLQASLRF
jgi:hypothetical protein